MLSWTYKNFIEMIEDQFYTESLVFSIYSNELDLVIECNRVLYGYRVNLREPSSLFYEVDWCAGDKVSDVLRLTNVLAFLLEKNLKFPSLTKVKPYYKDTDFSNFIKGFEGKAPLVVTEEKVQDAFLLRGVYIKH